MPARGILCKQVEPRVVVVWMKHHILTVGEEEDQYNPYYLQVLEYGHRRRHH